MKVFLSFFLLLSLNSNHAYAHPIKISTCIITSNQGSEFAKVELNFFADDFQAHLEKISGESIDLSTYSESTAKIVLAYINDHLKIKVSDDLKSLIFLKTTFKENVFHIEFNCPDLNTEAKEMTLNIENSILLEAFDDQSNILRIDLKNTGNYQTFDFDQNRTNITCTF